MVKRAPWGLLLILFAEGAFAQSIDLGSTRSALRPNAGGEPDEITVRVNLLDIADIDDRAQVFYVDAYVEVQWQDPRLAMNEALGESVGLRTFDVGDIWTPSLVVINDRGLDLLLPEVATADPQGNVVLQQRIAGPLAAQLDLHEFPFDTQRLTLDIVSYRYAPSEIRFSTASEMVADFARLDGEGWRFAASGPEASSYRIREGGPGRSQLTFAVTAERDAGYYILSLMLPMTLVLFLAWMVHWVPPKVGPARINMASATVFSFVAFEVSFRLMLPRIAYLTEADRFVLFSTLLVLVSLATTVLVTRLVEQERTVAAMRVTRGMRLAFPLAYLAIVLLTVAG